MPPVFSFFPQEFSGNVHPIAPREKNNSDNSQGANIEPKEPVSNKHNQGDDSTTNNKSTSSKGLSSKRAHKRVYQSMSGGPKQLVPLKKKDGEALWRKDIQYDFLHAVFTDPTKAFTKEPGSTEKLTFAEIYLQAMANSSKCSKILGEKLLGDQQAGIKIAMVCLLVNWGRMNTTLNFFPEMKTILRTYHPIPSLQTHNAPDYKQLQDAPRLKSILKGACDVSHEPLSIESMALQEKRPRTNPINLVFVLSIFNKVVNHEMIPADREFSFFDLLMDDTKSSESRARAFLWLTWAYLEAPEFTDNRDNPFGSEIPHLRTLNAEEMNNENIDTKAELLFGNQMTLQRLAILEAPGSTSGDNEENENTAVTDKLAAAEKTEKIPGIPLSIPKPRLRSAKDRRINDEFYALLRAKRSQRKVRRLARNNAIRDTWNRISGLDPIYDSDDDRNQAKLNGKSHGLGPGALATGVSTKYADYGERSLSIALALKRTAKKLATLE